MCPVACMVGTRQGSCWWDRGLLATGWGRDLCLCSLYVGEPGAVPPGGIGDSWPLEPECRTGVPRVGVSLGWGASPYSLGSRVGLGLHRGWLFSWDSPVVPKGARHSLVRRAWQDLPRGSGGKNAAV
jgi:hypothetical protein